MKALPCVIFAGGKSSRMGQDKALLPFGDRPTLAEYQYRRLQAYFPRVYLSTKAPERFDFDVPVICDTHAVFAPTAGFAAAFAALEDNAFFALSVDAPFVDAGVIDALFSQFEAAPCDAVIARTGSGMHPLCGIYRRSLQKDFERMLEADDHKLGRLLKSRDTAFVTFDDEAPFANLNHPHDYEEALRRTHESDTP